MEIILRDTDFIKKIIKHKDKYNFLTGIIKYPIRSVRLVLPDKQKRPLGKHKGNYKYGGKNGTHEYYFRRNT